MSENVPENALFVCFGAMSNVGMMTGLASLEAVKKCERGKVGIFCLGGLPTEAPTVLQKTRAVKRIITVDGCPLNCAQKIVEKAGFNVYKAINLVTDCEIQKKPADQFDPTEMQPVVDTIIKTIHAE